MNQKIDLPRAAEDLTMYAAVRLVGFEQHRMGDGFHQPEVRNEWVRDILRGMAELCGEDAAPLLQAFDRRLEDASGSAGVELLSLNDQKHAVQSLRQYVSALERTEGDQRSRLYNVKKLLEDMSAYLPWNVRDTGIYPARDEVGQALLRAVARRPIRFTRVLIGGETDPGGIEFLPGVVTDADADEVRHTAEFQRVAVEHPKLDELTVMRIVCVGGRQQPTAKAIDADGLDMAVIRENGERFMSRSEVCPVWAHELTVPVEEPCQQSEPEPEGFTLQTM